MTAARSRWPPSPSAFPSAFDIPPRRVPTLDYDHPKRLSSAQDAVKKRCARIDLMGWVDPEELVAEDATEEVEED